MHTMAKDEVLNLRVPAAVKAALKRAAQADDRSVSSMALRIIREWLEHQHPGGTAQRTTAPRSTRR
jgi:uncharacterized protein (DUF1778 family)